MGAFYAIRVGRKTGIFLSWEECQQYVMGYSGAQFKKFITKGEAYKYLNQPITLTTPLQISSVNKTPQVQNDALPKRSSEGHAEYGKSERSRPNYSYQSRYQNYQKNLEAQSVPDDPFGGREFGKKSKKKPVYNNNRYPEPTKTNDQSRTIIPPSTNTQPPSREPQKINVDPPLKIDNVVSPNQNKNEHELVGFHDYHEAKRLKLTQTDETKPLVIYTDGACRGNGRDNPRAGMGIYFGENDIRNASERLKGKQTNNRAELMAIIRAIEIASEHEQRKDITKAPRKIIIMTDSKYAINSMTIWVFNWMSNGWKSGAGKIIENKDLIERIKELMIDREGRILFQYVPAHKNIKGNEMADSLAVNGSVLPEIV
ncbi:hypothetical protein BB559_003609 [Furculomyces boomerangus]|uniref:Ribonuclease H n=1 Tax=Furculomyces boomerangus TaxID=61424 RepID=A0A2T9YKC7_9FUNG|nr:hypothetical protein BB559_003609 [Furculomyces boomerangus]